MSIKQWLQCLAPHFKTEEYAASRQSNGEYRLEKTLATVAPDETFDAIINVKSLCWLGMHFGINNSDRDVRPFESR